MDVIETFYHDDDDKQNIVLNIDFTKFKRKDGMFGKVAATKAISNDIFDAGKIVLTFFQSQCISEIMGM